MDHKIYNGFASYYAAMTNKRNFKEQIECVLNYFEYTHPCQSFLELFAGQAAHSIAAFSAGHSDVWAIDASTEMKEIALSAGFKDPDHYFVGNLPDVLINFADKKKFDCISCFFSSFNCINKTEVYISLYHLKSMLATNGKIIIEMHDISKTIEFIATAGDINPAFHEAITTNGQPFTYAWPSSKIKWDPYSYTAHVPITVMIPTSAGTDTVSLKAEEHIHSAEDILLLASILGYQTKVLTIDEYWEKCFEHSIVLELSAV